MSDFRYVYADCAASSPVLPCAMDAFDDAISLGYGNPNSAHSAGRLARKELEEARAIIADCINAEPEEIAFTPSATESCRVGMALCDINRCSEYEHKAVHDAAQIISLCVQNPNGISHILANNETGELYIDHVKELAKHNDVFTDATAAVGQVPVNVQSLGVTALAAGGHKFGAFPGIGFLYMRGGIKDDHTFPGTPPVTLAMAMARAFQYRMKHMGESTSYLLTKRMGLVDKLLAIPGAHINAHEKKCLPNIVSVRFDGINARELLTMLDVRGVCASAGSACNAESDVPSRVLMASGLSEEEAQSTIRFSFCPEHKPEDFNYVADAVRESVEQLRKLAE